MTSRGLLDGLPEEFLPQVHEPAFGFDGLLQATFCLSRLNRAGAWRSVCVRDRLNVVRPINETLAGPHRRAGLKDLFVTSNRAGLRCVYRGDGGVRGFQ